MKQTIAAFIAGFLVAVLWGVVVYNANAQPGFGIMNNIEINQVLKILKRMEKEGVKCKPEGAQ